MDSNAAELFAPTILSSDSSQTNQQPKTDSDTALSQVMSLPENSTSISPDMALCERASMRKHETVDKPFIVLKSRDDSHSLSSSPSASSVSQEMYSSHGTHFSHLKAHHSLYHQKFQKQEFGSLSSNNSVWDSGRNKWEDFSQMCQAAKLIDSNFHWVEPGILDELSDQSDYLVVGVIGLQGSGKSTILSLLGGNNEKDAYRSYIFQPQVKGVREDGVHETTGIDIFVTQERIILLDTQPVLSPSVLDSYIQYEKRCSPEYTCAEAIIETQSLQIASFLMSICNVMLVMQDWFTDLHFLEFLKNAEMLRPQHHPVTTNSEASSSNTDSSAEFLPTIVFVQNRAGPEIFTATAYEDMTLILERLFHTSKLPIHGTVNMHSTNVISATTPQQDYGCKQVNLFLLPTMEFYNLDTESAIKSSFEYRGFPSLSLLLKLFRDQIYAIPRSQISTTPLTEKNWFHFAARTWEAVKKSQLIDEYVRLLP